MRKAKRMLPYLGIILLSFYLLPLLMRDTGSSMIILLVFIPAICLACSVVYGIRNSFNLFYAFTVAILFAPSVFLYYNASAWVYILGYGVTALAGNALGMLFYKVRRK